MLDDGELQALARAVAALDDEDAGRPDDPALPKPGVFRVPELGAVEFYRRYVVNREGIVGRDADLPQVVSPSV